jgi:hypothetical protein
MGVLRSRLAGLAGCAVLVLGVAGGRGESTTHSQNRIGLLVGGVCGRFTFGRRVRRAGARCGPGWPAGVHDGQRRRWQPRSAAGRPGR